MKMILQRMTPGRNDWVSVVQFEAEDAPLVQEAAERLAQAGPIFWRVVADSPLLSVLAVYDHRGWKAVGEAMPADEMPWWESGLRTLKARFVRDDFAPTIPLER